MPKSSIPVHACKILKWCSIPNPLCNKYLSPLCFQQIVYFLPAHWEQRPNLTKYDSRQRKVQTRIWRLWERSTIYFGHGDAALRDVEKRCFVCCQQYLKICQNLLPAHLGLSESLKVNLSTKDSPTQDAWCCNHDLLSFAFLLRRDVHVATILSEWYFQLSLQGMFTGERLCSCRSADFPNPSSSFPEHLKPPLT